MPASVLWPFELTYFPGSLRNLAPSQGCVMYMIIQLVLGFQLYHAFGLFVITGSLSYRTCSCTQLQVKCSFSVGLELRREMLDLPFYLGMGHYRYRVSNPWLTRSKCRVNAIWMLSAVPWKLGNLFAWIWRWECVKSNNTHTIRDNSQT